MVEIVSQKVYQQVCTVKKIEERYRTEWVSGQGKDALTREVSEGWYVTFHENLTAIKCETKPVCKVGDKAICTWEFQSP
jgi:hypothetical protein